MSFRLYCDKQIFRMSVLNVSNTVSASSVNTALMLHFIIINTSVDNNVVYHRMILHSLAVYHLWNFE